MALDAVNYLLSRVEALTAEVKHLRESMTTQAHVLRELLQTLADDGEDQPAPPTPTLDGDAVGGDRDQSQAL